MTGTSTNPATTDGRAPQHRLQRTKQAMHPRDADIKRRHDLTAHLYGHHFALLGHGDI
jgi:hypothetical protein